jgi:hypothetical protein
MSTLRILERPTRFQHLLARHLEEGDHIQIRESRWTNWGWEYTSRYPRVDGASVGLLRVQLILDGEPWRAWRWEKIWKVIE